MERRRTPKEGLFKAMMEVAGDAIVVIDGRGKVVFWNRAAEETFGYSEEEMLGRSIALIMPEDLRRRHSEALSKAAERGGSRTRIELVGIKKDGTEIPFEMSVGSLKVEDETFFVGVLRDVTKRKEAEERLRDFVELSTVGIWCFRLREPIDVNLEDRIIEEAFESICVECNEAYAEMIGTTKEKVLGMKLREVMPDTEENREYLRSFIRNGFRISGGMSHEVDRKGEEKFFSNSIVGIVRNGKLVEAWGTQIDVTQRIMAQRELERISREKEEIFQSLGSATFILDPEFTILDVNRAILSTTGMSKEELVGRKCYEVFHGSRQPPDDCPIKEMLSSKKYSTFEREMETSFGTFLVLCTPIVQRGRIVSIIHSGVDVTERRKLEEQLRQAQKMEAVGRLAGGIAHDFNNILTAIQGFAELAMTKLKEDDPIYRWIKEIQGSAVKASDLTRQLLLFSRRHHMEMGPLDLNSLVEGMVRMLGRLIGENIALDVELSNELWLVRADRGGMEQVMMNLVVNARDAMPKGGTVRIRTENRHVDESYCEIYSYARPGRFVCLSVEDTGVGMDEETLKHIFEPFFTTKKDGTGLGLSVVYGIVKQHGGWINVYSVPGHGTTFKVYIPAILAEPEVEEDKVSLEELRGKGQKVLVVEDDDGVLRFVRDVLSENGYEVTSARTISEARELAGKHDVLLCDESLPDGRGTTLVEQFPRAILMSGYWGKKPEGCLYLAKPFSSRELLEAIKKALEGGS
ncbi:MAG: hypothetical protein DRQ08_07105 [Candidatus Latescibacterota bacterium]|nr:MAG: hypothetical protein DRQ08_07105 [Candidatus Latescibacterota bacterium]